ncbi:MAG TPA: hypothetical protein VIG30_13490 [Ktedonobacterales bacterium]|jgi:acyl dehydratase
MPTGTIPQVGAVISLTKQISDADVALFTLVATDQPPTPEEPAKPEPPGPTLVPGALVAALLAAAAAQHAGGLAAATLTRAEISCAASAQTDDTLTASAEVLAADAATGTLRVGVHCANQTGARLAEGVFELRARG